MCNNIRTIPRSTETALPRVSKLTKSGCDKAKKNVLNSLAPLNQKSCLCNSYIAGAREVSDLKVKGATRPRPLNQILPKHEVYNYFVSHP